MTRPFRLLAGFLLAGFLALPAALFALPAAAATDRATVEADFRRWLEAEIWPEAKAAGVSRATFDAAFKGVTLDWKLPELVPPGTAKPHVVEHQAEFRSPAAYFDEKRLAAQARIGRERLARHAKTIAAIEKRYGVPGPILVAIWGRESGYGGVAIPHPALRTLATHAFMGRRKEVFRPEVVAALRIVQSGDIPLARMKSSWAGALGQPQFLPTHFLNYAVDFDGDGKRDIWDSVPDVLASIANFLKEAGWDPARGWGVEAVAPEGICSLEGPEQGAGMAEWAALGVTRPGGSELPNLAANRESFLLMPAGRFGPAFIVSGNFYVIKKYNYSDLYALYVGHLADRYADNRPFRGRWGKVGGFTRADVQKMQLRFQKDGYDVGNPDGLIGFKTRVAVGMIQAKSGKPVTCMPDAAMVRAAG